MLHAFKRWLRAQLFSKEELEYQAKRIALKQMQESVNIVSLARQQLSGFDPLSINEDILRNRDNITVLDGLGEEERIEFINNVHALYANPALQVIVDYLIRAQVLHGHADADSVTGLNFSRATVNGLLLFKDEVDRFEGIYQVNHKAADTDYEETEVL